MKNSLIHEENNGLTSKIDNIISSEELSSPDIRFSNIVNSKDINNQKQITFKKTLNKTQGIRNNNAHKMRNDKEKDVNLNKKKFK